LPLGVDFGDLGAKFGGNSSTDNELSIRIFLCRQPAERFMGFQLPGSSESQQPRKESGRSVNATHPPASRLAVTLICTLVKI